MGATRQAVTLRCSLTPMQAQPCARGRGHPGKWISVHVEGVQQQLLSVFLLLCGGGHGL